MADEILDFMCVLGGRGIEHGSDVGQQLLNLVGRDELARRRRIPVVCGVFSGLLRNFSACVRDDVTPLLSE